MAISHIAFDLKDGFVNNWLVAGPQAKPASGCSSTLDAQAKAHLTQAHFEQSSGITRAPVEPGPLRESQFTIGDFQGEWRYYRCQEDHLVDFSSTASTCQYMRAWAFTQVFADSPQTARFTLAAFGPLDVWVNKKSVFHFDGYPDQFTRHSFEVALTKGRNQLLVRLAGLATPVCRLAFTLQLSGEGLSVRVPSQIPSIPRRMELEEINEQIYIDRDVYVGDQRIRLNWPEGLEKATYQDARLMNAEGFIYGQAEDVGKPNSTTTLGIPTSLKPGLHRVFVMPRAWEYYDSQIRVTKEFKLQALGLSQFSEGPYGDLEERAREALLTARQYENNLFAEIARMAIGLWSEVERKPLNQAILAVERRQAGSELEMLALAGMLTRYGQESGFPEGMQEPIQAALLGYRYSQDDPGDDLLAFQQEESQPLFYTGQILAGQLFREAEFRSSGLRGAQLREQGETHMLAWMQARAAAGFAGWNSKAAYANTFVALSHLVDLAESEPVFELASVLMDKLFFSLALNSHRGVFGVAHAGASLDSVKSGLLEPTSGITRLMWGMGIYNQHLAGPVSLAQMKNYELPEVLAAIAASLPVEQLSHEQQTGGEQSANIVNYRTPNYLLSAAQDYQPGQPGQREHIWQATFGPQSVVFVNHPGHANEDSPLTPNFWVGNGSLPRVAQWKDTLIAIYQIPEDALIDYTHAYFPTIDFDEHCLRGNTAFARKGEGYLALTAANGLEALKLGRTAHRELRSSGRHNVWVCQMGQSAVDGSFAEFQEKVLAQAPRFEDQRVELQTLRGERLSFGWQGELLVNQQAQPLRGFKHFENAYTTTDLPCDEMTIQTGDYLLRLKFHDRADDAAAAG